MQDKKIDFIQVDSGIPGIDAWAVHPDSQQDMDDEINKALAKAGLPTLGDLINDL